jgi:non-reducing end alpha-L-arabinofuranosidase
MVCTTSATIAAFVGVFFVAACGATGPCDIFEADGAPCVAAHSTVRALYNAFDGPLYSVRRESDKQSKDIFVLAAGGFADSASQDTFCQGTVCVFDRVYDQTTNQNHLGIGPPGGAHWKKDIPAVATAGPLTVGGKKVYGIRMDPPSGYRNDTTSGIAVDDEAETIYAVFNGSHYNDRCCFDYGNAETNDLDDGAGTMEALYFGNAKGGLNHGGAGKGPWIMADMENALWGADVVKSNERPINHDYVTAMIKGDVSTNAPGGHWAIKGGDATNGTLKVYWDGKRAPGYAPMKKQGAIILGIGGDNSDGAVGTFYEGVMTKGYTSNAADEAVQANIVAAGYGR